MPAEWWRREAVNWKEKVIFPPRPQAAKTPRNSFQRAAVAALSRLLLHWTFCHVTASFFQANLKPQTERNPSLELEEICTSSSQDKTQNSSHNTRLDMSKKEGSLSKEQATNGHNSVVLAEQTEWLSRKRRLRQSSISVPSIRQSRGQFFIKKSDNPIIR